jgi:8-hydroxy-5-deazaflavin:NADPH oxidoreductase
MRIGIVGAGKIGGTLAELWTRSGHDVAVSNSRGPETLAELVEALGPSAHAMTVEEAARFGDVVVLAAPFRKPEALPPPLAVVGKVVVDAMNPYAEGGGLIDLEGKTSSAVTAERLPGARIVKAFNTIYFETLRTEGRRSVPEDQRFVIFVAGDDARAKATVGRLIEEIGFTPIDTGPLVHGGRLQEPGSRIFKTPMLAPEARRTISILG